MARKKLLDLENDGDEGSSLSEVLPDMAELKAKFGEESIKIAVFRLSDNGQDWEKVASYPIDQLEPDTVAEKFGGGKFRFRATKDDGTYKGQYTMTYAKPKLPQANNLPQIIQQKDDSKEYVLEFMKSELSSRDMLMAKLVEAMNKPQQQAPQHNIMEMIQALATLKTLDKSPHDNFSQIMEVFKMGTNIAKTMGENSIPEAPENKFINLLIEQLAPRLLGLMSAKGGQSSVPTMKSGVAPTNVNPPVNALAEISNSPQEKKPMEFISDFEKTLIEKLSGMEKNIVALADMNFSTERAGDYLIDEFDDGQLKSLEEYLKEYKHNRILEFIPSFQKYNVWFDKLVEYLTESIKEFLTENAEIVDSGNGQDKDPVELKTEDKIPATVNQ